MTVIAGFENLKSVGISESYAVNFVQYNFDNTRHLLADFGGEFHAHIKGFRLNSDNCCNRCLANQPRQVNYLKNAYLMDRGFEPRWAVFHIINGKPVYGARLSPTPDRINNDETIGFGDNIQQAESVRAAFNNRDIFRQRLFDELVGHMDSYALIREEDIADTQYDDSWFRFDGFAYRFLPSKGRRFGEGVEENKLFTTFTMLPSPEGRGAILDCYSLPACAGLL